MIARSGVWKMPPVTVAEVKEHVAFLRAVHLASSRGGGESHEGGSLYFDGPQLRAAVRAYLVWLAAEAAGAPLGGVALVTRAPPLAVAWCTRTYSRSASSPGTVGLPHDGAKGEVGGATRGPGTRVRHVVAGSAGAPVGWTRRRTHPPCTRRGGKCA